MLCGLSETALFSSNTYAISHIVMAPLFYESQVLHQLPLANTEMFQVLGELHKTFFGHSDQRILDLK